MEKMKEPERELKQLNDMKEYWKKETGHEPDPTVEEAILMFRRPPNKLALNKMKDCIRSSATHGYGNRGTVDVFLKIAEWRLRCG